MGSRPRVSSGVIQERIPQHVRGKSEAKPEGEREALRTSWRFNLNFYSALSFTENLIWG